MKKVLILVMAFISMNAVAQEKQRTERAALSAEQQATLLTKRMTLALDLSSAQQTQVQALNLEQAKMRKSKMEARKAIKDADDAKKPSTEERYAMQTEKLDQQIALKGKMKKILSAEQYERWEKLAMRKGKRKKGKGRKGKKGEAKKQRNKQ